MGWTRRYKVFVSVFCVAFVLSVSTLVFATVNYLEFYVALNNLYLRVDSFDYEIFELGGRKIVCVNGNLTLIHNSSYNGLVLESVYVSMFLEGESQPFFERRFWLDGESLPPFSSVFLVVKNQNLTDNIEGFVQLKEQGESVDLTVKTCVFIYVFGGPFATKVFLEDFELTI